ncbi:hypothetical protein [Selenomonas sp.]|uniref:hypothetical protein n=1 Tax=Selenomonas sp. TaxID=2053611 RepID=UPI0025F03FAA|nr:hypothetical protein [Selenomonas sp.]MBQ1866694.1 hypothetical protein [Selenomonas sp.]
MKKIVLLLFLCLSVFGVNGWNLPNTANAGFALNGRYLNGDQNYPLAYGHAGSMTYVDLSSCTFVYNNDEEYEFAANTYTTSKIGNSETGTVYFRQKKDGVSLPEYSTKYSKGWKTLPSWKNYSGSPLNYGSYHTFFDRFCPFEHYEFLIIYEQLWGVSYSEL